MIKSEDKLALLMLFEFRKITVFSGCQPLQILLRSLLKTHSRITVERHIVQARSYFTLYVRLSNFSVNLRFFSSTKTPDFRQPVIYINLISKTNL